MSIKAYKGFNRDMTCRGFQFEEGKTYHEDEAELCEKGFHACEDPLDCFDYYSPAISEYHEVEIDDVTAEMGDDSKICGRTIKIGKKLDIADIVKAHFEYVKNNCTKIIEKGDAEQASAGDRGAVSIGSWGTASVGQYGTASAGVFGIASAGKYSIASVKDFGTASAGIYGIATAGFYGMASTGDFGIACTGDYGIACTKEYGAASAGDYGKAVSGGAASVGKDGVAVAKGKMCMVKGELGSILVIVEEKDDFSVKEWGSALVDGETIKPDTWYILKDGKFVEVGEGSEK